MSDDAVNDFLAHYGKKGMKWGVRKRRNEAARAQKFGPSKESKQALRIYTKGKTSGVKSLTNQEINTFTTRVRLEQSFAAAQPKSAFKRGSDFVKEILGVGRTVNDAISFAQSPAGSTLKNAMKKPKAET